MTDKEQESGVSSPSENPKHEYLEVTGTANTVANLMRRPLPQVSEMTGTFEKLRNLREMIAEQKEKERNVPDSTIEDEDDQGNDNTVTITVNNTLLGQYMTLAESDESDSEHDSDIVNDVAPPKDSSSDSDGTSSEDEENKIVMSLAEKDHEPLVQILSESEDDDGEVDSTNRAKRQRLE